VAQRCGALLQGERGEPGVKGDLGDTGPPGKNVSQLFCLLYFAVLQHNLRMLQPYSSNCVEMKTHKRNFMCGNYCSGNYA